MKAFSTWVLLCMLCLLSGTPPFSYLPWQLFPLHFFLIQTWSDVINGDRFFVWFSECCFPRYDLRGLLGVRYQVAKHMRRDVTHEDDLSWRGCCPFHSYLLHHLTLLCLAGHQTVLPHSCSALWWSWRQRVRTTWPTSIASSPPSWRSCTRWHESTSSPPARRPLQVSVFCYLCFLFLWSEGQLVDVSDYWCTVLIIWLC